MSSGHTPQGADISDEGHLVPTIIMIAVGTRCACPQLAVWHPAFTLKVVRPCHLATRLREQIFRTRGTSSLPVIE